VIWEVCPCGRLEEGEISEEEEARQFGTWRERFASRKE
jgi:hypothetical protein